MTCFPDRKTCACDNVFEGSRTTTKVLRTFVFSALLIVLPVATVAAQEPRLSAAGAQLGVNIATIAATIAADNAEYSPRLGLAVGGFARFSLTDNVAFQLEGLFSQKGSKIEERGTTLTLTVPYVEIPVLLRVPVSV